jgi:hypothetical protein
MFIGAPAFVCPGRWGLARFFPDAIYDDRSAVSKVTFADDRDAGIFIGAASNRHG